MTYGKKFFTFLFSAAVLFFLSSAPVNAQFGLRISIKDAAKKPVSSKPAVKVVRTTKIQKVIVPVREIRTETRLVKTSNLTVTTEPGAEVFLEGLFPGKPLLKPVTANRNGVAVFENLRAGKYKLKASLDGFETQEQDIVEILPQKTLGINLDLQPVTYKLKIETNLTDGEIRYAPANYRGVDAKGSIISEELGNYCIVKIQQNGEAVISDLKKGYYNIDIRPSALEYEPTLAGINVPEDTEQDDETASSETKTFEIELEKKISLQTFGTAWTPDEWALPTGWTLNKGLKINNTPGLALPRSEQYRYYTNFEMISDVKSLDGGTIGFALRAIDDKNFYFIQISGARAREPNVAKGYIVKNGTATQIFSVSTAPFASTIEQGKFFRVIIKADEKGFRISIDDSETGIREAVGVVTDRDNTFQKGAVGIISRERANFEVSYFEVCASFCR